MVSVCMATYNGEKYVQAQIDSILNQLTPNDELVISDDGSTDDTLAIIGAIKDRRLRLLHNKGYKGVVGNFENALQAAQGQYIFLSDQDDVWLPGKVAACTKLLENYPLVVTDCYVVDDDLQPEDQSYFQVFKSKPGILRNLKKNAYQGCCMCFQKQVLQVALPFPPGLPMHDSWLGFVAELMFKSHFEPVRWSLYRRHESTATHQQIGHSDGTLKQKVGYRINLIKNLVVLFAQRKRKKGTIKNA